MYTVKHFFNNYLKQLAIYFLFLVLVFDEFSPLDIFILYCPLYIGIAFYTRFINLNNTKAYYVLRNVYRNTRKSASVTTGM